MSDQVPPEVVTERYQRLIALQEKVCLAGNEALVGTEVELLVSADSSRKSAEHDRLTGRARDGRLVHFAPVGVDGPIRPGDIVTTTITSAAPHHLMADGGVLTVRNTRAGDAHEANLRPVTASTGGVWACRRSAPDRPSRSRPAARRVAATDDGTQCEQRSGRFSIGVQTIRGATAQDREEGRRGDRPGARAVVVAVAVLVAVVSLALPHTGSVNGFDV